MNDVLVLMEIVTLAIVSALAVYEANPSVFYVGSAHGGVWKTTNNGATFTPQFQNEGLISIGAIAVSQKDPDLVWVGTGEGNPRNSVSFGDGVYRSNDGGQTWQRIDTGRDRHYTWGLAVDPNDSDCWFISACPGPTPFSGPILNPCHACGIG